MLKYVFINSVLSVYNKNGWSEQTKIIVVDVVFFWFVLVCLLCFLQEIYLKIDVKGIGKDHAKNKDEVNDTRSVEQNPVTKASLSYDGDRNVRNLLI